MRRKFYARWHGIGVIEAVGDDVWHLRPGQRYVHLDAALLIAADQVAAEIARLLDGGEVLSMKEAKRLRSAGPARSFAEA